MPAYLIAQIDVSDMGPYQEYARDAGPVVAEYGGRFLARAGRTQSLEGFEQTRVAIGEHLNWEAAAGFYDSPHYAEARAALDGGVTRDICITEALDGV